MSVYYFDANIQVKYYPGERILDLIPEEGVTDLRALGLNERQIEALRLIVNEGKEITNRGYRARFHVTHTTAHRDIGQLLELGWVKTVGRGRGRKYVASETSM